MRLINTVQFTPPRKNKKGFTLVELAIVLMIISLLIGGILVAQSMIKTAQINGVVRQLSQYDVAIANFYTKYNQLPGDSNLFTTAGNNNGLIQASSGGGTWTEENAIWGHLGAGVGLKNWKNQDYPIYNESIAGSINEDVCPRFKIEQDKTLAPCLHVKQFLAVTNQYYYDNKLNNSPWDSQGSMVIKPVDVLAIDKKADDGIANTGKVQGFGGSCISGASYLVSNNSFQCVPVIDVGFSGGVGN